MRRVIVVTDGDCRALNAVEIAARNIGARCISLSGCRHPKDTHWTPNDMEELILSTPRDPVVVLVDDEGADGEGWGERIVRHLSQSDRIHLMGVIAVASDMKEGLSIHVDASVTAAGQVVTDAVDKQGLPVLERFGFLQGDTVENLGQLDIPLVVGLGDPGKMNFADDAKKGAPITTKAVRLVLDGIPAHVR